MWSGGKLLRDYGLVRRRNQVLTHLVSIHKGVSTQQQRPESPTVTVTWHASKYKVHKLHQRYMLSVDSHNVYFLTDDVTVVELIFPVFYSNAHDICRIVQEQCESRGGRPGLSVLTSLLVSVDVKIY